MRISLRRWQPSLVPRSCSKGNDPSLFLSLSKRARGKLTSLGFLQLMIRVLPVCRWGGKLKYPLIITSLIKMQCPPRYGKPILFLEPASIQLVVHEELNQE